MNTYCKCGYEDRRIYIRNVGHCSMCGRRKRLYRIPSLNEVKSMRMNNYGESNRPNRGTAKKLYDAFKMYGAMAKDLHYTPLGGLGHWYCTFSDGIMRQCGWDAKRKKAWVKGLHRRKNKKYYM